MTFSPSIGRKETRLIFHSSYFFGVVRFFFFGSLIGGLSLEIPHDFCHDDGGVTLVIKEKYRKDKETTENR
jgi:hypothetical protein